VRKKTFANILNAKHLKSHKTCKNYRNKEVFPTELTSDEEMERNFDKWRQMNVLHECDGLNVCTRKYQINKKSGSMNVMD
jgi:hypothetical protein